MFASKAVLSILLASVALAADLSGTSALEYTRRAVAFGPRPPGSEADKALQNYILSELRMRGCEVIEDAFHGPDSQRAYLHEKYNR